MITLVMKDIGMAVSCLIVEHARDRQTRTGNLVWGLNCLCRRCRR
jgi:hypothetical protein